MQTRSLELASGKIDDRGEGSRGSFYSCRIKKCDKGWRIGSRERNWAIVKKEKFGEEERRYLEENS